MFGQDPGASGNWPTLDPVGPPQENGTLVLGLGNVLWADEGFGVRAAEALNAQWQLPPEARVMDGGTQGIFLLPWVQTARQLLILDAVDYGLEPGTLKLVTGDDVPSFMGVRKVSMHQAGFQEVLMSARLTDQYPERIALIGVQPELLDDYGGSLRPVVRARIPEAVALAVRVLREWGVEPVARPECPGAKDRLGPDALNLSAYELGNPRITGAL
jgi:hydrogenase maturation protease